jgi:hypothetical protein
MKINKSVANFLKAIGTNVYAYSNGKTDMHYVPSLDEGMERNNHGSDLYFIANPSSGMKESSITSLTSNFVDLDAGRPTETSYHSTKVVDAFKRKVRDALASDEFRDLKPTYIVETRNGYHLYWVYDCSVNATSEMIQRWKVVEKYLTLRFAAYGADPYVIKPNQLMRVPGSYWHKKWSGNKKFPAFLTTIVSTKNRRPLYNFYELERMVANNGRETFIRNEPVLAVNRANSSYKPCQDVNRSNKGDYECDAAGSENRQIGSVNTKVLTDVRNMLKNMGMSYMADKVSDVITSISNVS